MAYDHRAAGVNGNSLLDNSMQNMSSMGLPIKTGSMHAQIPSTILKNLTNQNVNTTQGTIPNYNPAAVENMINQMASMNPQSVGDSISSNLNPEMFMMSSG